MGVEHSPYKGTQTEEQTTTVVEKHFFIDRNTHFTNRIFFFIFCKALRTEMYRRYIHVKSIIIIIIVIINVQFSRVKHTCLQNGKTTAVYHLEVSSRQLLIVTI